MGGVGALWGSEMKKWFVVVVLLLGITDETCAQENNFPALATESDSSSAKAIPGTRWAMASSSVDDFFVAPALRLSFTEPTVPEFGTSTMTVPMASPAPVPKRHIVVRVEDYHVQIGLGFTYVRFRSTAFDVGMYGLNTSVVYFPNRWLGFEGNFTATVGPHVFNNNIDQTRYAGITGGPKIIWRKEEWEPWVHALVGVAHINPQLAGASKNGAAIELGGGIDYPLGFRLALRLEGDWLRTEIASSSQENFQLVTGVVFRF